MQIRTATLDDIPMLVALRMEFIREMHPALPPDQLMTLAGVLTDYFQRHINVDFWGYFAVVDDIVASVVHLVTMERPANPRIATGKIGMILNVYTKPPYRKRGLASLLLREAMRDAEVQGVSVIELQASEMGKHVYEQLGFEVQQTAYTPMVYNIGKPHGTTHDEA